MDKSGGIFLFVQNNSFCSNKCNRKNITNFFLQPLNEPNTAKLCFLVVLNHIWGKITENRLSQNEAQNYSES